jgi:hypothetical protein
VTGLPPVTCAGTRKDGQPCGVTLNLSPTTGLCLQHDPERAVERAVMHETGGYASRISRREAKAAAPPTVPKAPTTIEEAESFASWLTHAVCSGKIDAKVAQVAAGCLREFRGAAEKARLEREVRALREELAAARGRMAAR